MDANMSRKESEMVKLLDREILTREVTEWKGLHLFHAHFSSCSQKVRLVLAEKGIAWQSHPIDLGANENISERYLGINPRGLVPALVDDGDVHIESNDIIFHLEDKFPQPVLIPAANRGEAEAILRAEDDLHLDIRNVTFHFLFETPAPPKSAKDLENYRRFGASTVAGEPDAQKEKEIRYWRTYGEQRVSQADARKSVAALGRAFAGVEARLADSDYLFGAELTIIDIAWFIYAHRMVLAGYPLAAQHPAMGAWYKRLSNRPGWATEITMPPPLAAVIERHQQRLTKEGHSITQVCGMTAAG
ncbi:glutathione S-transferase family protein [Rhizorhabdus dicambivorans]|uniref:Glutathione S-transferase family protein n=2 Tax=Rhizorhabdus dicambivorans TaxID=1850238 RepID=A0A2A4FN91_9SPHN|nr:glutathione S-transferase family protein [Rhizorhabdus dicambivorans]ATE65468.1 glutathione S-transferase family protein [Rhizorhabdus dicambivorans]PCE39873.1 glutathione S-transferase family protein [Rhizorhabdus dicambivorans]